MKKVLLLSVLTLLLTSAFSQGIIRGKVTDGSNGEELIGASVIIDGTFKGAQADLDGNFSIENLEPGTYNLSCSFITYDKITKTVEVKDGEVTVVNFNMLPTSFEVDVVEIVEKQDKRVSVYMDNVKKKDPTMMDYISNQQIKKTGETDAAGALSKVTGVSTVGNYVFVRGLSDRYIKTTLNGAEIPSLDPKRNSVQMDLFPTNLIDNLVVVKTSSADLPADFAGAYINVITRDFPEQFTFNYSGSFGYNTNATFNNDFLTSQTSSTDWIGFDNGSRDYPELIDQAGGVPAQSFANYYDALVLAGFEQDLANIGITDASQIGTGSGQTSIYQVINQVDGIESLSQVQNEFIPAANEIKNEQLSNMAKGFGNTWENERKAPMLDISQSLSFGNQGKLFGRPLGYIVGIQYKRSNRFYDNGETGRYTLTGNENEIDNLNTERLLKDSQGNQSTYTSALLNLSYKLNEHNKLGFTFMPNVSGVNNSRYQDGINPSDEIGLGQQQRQQRYLERSMVVYQLRGEHYAPAFRKAKIDWMGSYTTGVQSTPDMRVFINSYSTDDNGDVQYAIQDNLYPSPTRYYRSMTDNILDLKANIEFPFENKTGLNNKLKFGGSYVAKTREYAENRYSFISNNLDFNGSPSDYFAEQNLNVGATGGNLILRDDTDIQNSYTASMDVLGAYGMIDLNVTKRLRVNTGLRMETTDMLLESAKIAADDLTGPNADNFRGGLDLVDFLPSANITYLLRQKDIATTNLRFAASQSVARPMFREKAPFSVYDFEVQEQQTGNVNLERTRINNYDLRLEHYPYPGEIYSVSVFYKEFTDPIEQVIISTAGNTEITWVNVESAKVLGAEFEVRKSLGFLGEAFQPFGIGANLTLVKSETKVAADELELIHATDPDHADTRPMFGQSPYIFNGIVSYDNDSIGFNVSLSYNIQGEKLVLVTKGGTPDIYDQPRGNLNLTIGKKLGEHFSVNFKARNLLNPDYLQTYRFKGEDYTFQRMQWGRTFSVGFSYNI